MSFFKVNSLFPTQKFISNVVVELFFKSLDHFGFYFTGNAVETFKFFNVHNYKQILWNYKQSLMVG